MMRTGIFLAVAVSVGVQFASPCHAEAKIWVVAVGISRYQNSDWDLGSPAAEAEQIRERVLKGRSVTAETPFGRPDAQQAGDARRAIATCTTFEGQGTDGAVVCLTDAHATKANIESALTDWLPRRAGSDDAVLIYFSGHGTHGSDIAPIDEDDGSDEYLVPHDAEPAGGNRVNFATLIRDDVFGQWIASLPCRLVTIVIDSCYAGGAPRDLAVGAKTVGDSAELADDFLSDIRKMKDITKAGTFPLAACRSDEIAFDDVFTPRFLRSFGPDRPRNRSDREVLQALVVEVAAESGGSQTPVWIDNARSEPRPISTFLGPERIRPEILITKVPPYDPVGGTLTRYEIEGVVKGAKDPATLQVVIYARTDYLYVQPLTTEPLTPIDRGGKWATWTHGGAKYAALLVRSTYKHDQHKDTLAALPSVGGDILASTGEIEGTKK